MDLNTFTNTAALARDIEQSLDAPGPSPSVYDFVHFAEERFGAVADEGVASDLYEAVCDEDDLGGFDNSASFGVAVAFRLAVMFGMN